MNELECWKYIRGLYQEAIENDSVEKNPLTTNGLCYAIGKTLSVGEISFQVRDAMEKKIYDRLPDGWLYIAKYDLDGAAIRVAFCTDRIAEMEPDERFNHQDAVAMAT